MKFNSIFDVKAKKKGIMLFALALVALIMAGTLISCAALPKNKNITTTQTTVTTIFSQTTNLTGTQTGTTISSSSPVIKTGSGSYVGPAANNSIEIKISPVQGSTSVSRVFMLSETVKPAFDALALKKDDQVKISYYEQSVGQPVITSIEKI